MTELADDGETILVPGEKSRNTEEVEAESISYAVCQYYGIETGENSFGYIATWSKVHTPMCLKIFLVGDLIHLI